MEPGPRCPPQGGSEIIITDRRWNAHVRNIPRAVHRALRVAGCEASVVLTDDRTIKQLNARDRNKNKPTNVLTYEMPAEILLAFGTVRREAAQAQKSVADHLTHLLVHGALHLQGFDHHHAGDARRMEGREAKLLARLKVPNPWKNK